MNLKKILAASAISLSMVAGVGAAIGVSAGANLKVDEAKAAVSYSGTFFLELADVWTSTDSQIGLYLMNSAKDEVVWGDLKTPYGGTYLDYSYAGLSFQPAYVIAMRVAKNTSAWGGDAIWESADLYSRTGDVGVTGKDSIWLGEHTEGKYTKNSAYVMDRGFIRGGEYKTWSTTTINIELPYLKVADGGTMEAYGEVTLSKSSLKGQKGTSDVWSNTWSCHKSLSSAFGGTSGSDNVDLETPDTYMVYFNYSTRNIYFTTEVLAAADEWAQVFLKGGCVTASTGTKAKWGDHATSFAGLDPEIRALFTKEEHVAFDADTDTFLAAAVQRYDYVLQLYGVNAGNTDALGYSDFMGRESKLSLSKTLAPSVTRESNGNVMVITAVAASVALLGATGFFLLRRRKEDR